MTLIMRFHIHEGLNKEKPDTVEAAESHLSSNLIPALTFTILNGNNIDYLSSQPNTHYCIFHVMLALLMFAYLGARQTTSQ